MNTFFIRIIFVFIFFCFQFYASGQDMSGEWNGILKQEAGGAATAYYFSLHLSQKGNIITGTSKVNFIDKPNYFAIMELKGSFDGQYLEFTEIKIKEQQTFSGLEWCLKKAKLKFTIKKDGFCIEGTWGGNTLSNAICTPGTMTLCKIVPIAAN